MSQLQKAANGLKNGRANPCTSQLRAAANGLKNGSFVLLYDGDGREGECDLLFHASHATPEKVSILRKDGGGLICLATSKEVAEKIRLPYMSDVLSESNYPLLRAISLQRAPYGDAPAFSITVNHKKAYTGITDNDRALAMKSFAGILAANNCLRSDFISNFVSPGHLHLLIGRDLENRRGHTELALELARLAKMAPAIVLCEMMDVGKALSKTKAKEYAKKRGFAFVEGKELSKTKIKRKKYAKTHVSRLSRERG